MISVGGIILLFALLRWAFKRTAVDDLRWEGGTKWR